MSYKLGEVVLRCKPLVHTLNDNQKSIRCDFCFAVDESLKKCSRCQAMYYCQRKCQKLDWIECHKNECQIMSKFKDKLGADCDRFLLRLWLLTYHTQRQSETHELFNGQQRSLNDLMTHSQEVKEDVKRVKYFDDVFERFQSCGLDVDREQLFILFCKICINSFSILNEDLNQIGSGLYICPSILNHSCHPNAATIFNGIDLEVRAIRPIEPKQEVVINYLDLKLCPNERRTRLREQYYFDCNCVKCVDKSDSDIDYSLVKSLDEEFDELISTQDNWQKCYEIGMKSLPLYHQIYGHFHPDLTVQLMRVLKVNALITDSLEEKNILELIRKTQKSIKITHGMNHKVFDLFKQTIGLY